MRLMRTFQVTQLDSVASVDLRTLKRFNIVEIRFSRHRAFFELVKALFSPPDRAEAESGCVSLDQLPRRPRLHA